MLAPLRITERAIGDVVVLHLEGQLVFDEGDRIFRDRVKDLARMGSRYILVDLCDVTYIDSGGVGAVVEMYLHLMKLGGRLALVRLSSCAQRVLQITHLSTALDVFEDEDSAIRGVHSPSTHAHF